MHTFILRIYICGIQLQEQRYHISGIAVPVYWNSGAILAGIFNPVIRRLLLIASLIIFIFGGLTIGAAKLMSDVYSAKHGLKYDVATVAFTDNRKRVLKDVERYIVKSSSIVIFSKQDGRDSMIEIQKASIKYIETTTRE